MSICCFHLDHFLWLPHGPGPAGACSAEGHCCNLFQDGPCITTWSPR